MEISKKQELPSGLWVVATPIGNLADLSQRAAQALREAPLLLCEDTRQTQKLLGALGIPLSGRRLERLDAHAGDAKLESLARALGEGGTMALVTDAGTPAISDPGSKLVRLALERGVRVTPLPGPSAPVVLLSAAGFGDGNFVFRGFFPRKKTEKMNELELAKRTEAARVFVWFESPERIRASLEVLAEAMPSARVVAAKELTKFHERFFQGSAGEVLAAVGAELEREGERGEWCFAAEFPAQDDASQSSDTKSSEWVKALHCLLDARVSASEAARRVSQHYGASRKSVYEAALKISGKKL